MLVARANCAAIRSEPRKVIIRPRLPKTKEDGRERDRFADVAHTELPNWICFLYEPKFAKSRGAALRAVFHLSQSNSVNSDDFFRRFGSALTNGLHRDNERF